MKTINIPTHSDSRRQLIEVLGQYQINEPVKHLYFSIINPNNSVANHYHKKKKEWICILQGKARITVDKESEIITEPKLIEIPPNTWHLIENIDNHNPVYLLGIGNQPYNPNEPDIFVKGEIKSESN